MSVTPPPRARWLTTAGTYLGCWAAVVAVWGIVIALSSREQPQNCWLCFSEQEFAVVLLAMVAYSSLLGHALAIVTMVLLRRRRLASVPAALIGFGVSVVGTLIVFYWTYMHI